MAKKKTSGFVLILILLGVGALAFFGEDIPFQIGCEDIYCQEFNYVCCGEDILNPIKIAMGSYSYNYCPTTATRCEAKNINGYLYECHGITWDIFGQVQCSGTPIKQCTNSCGITPGKYAITAGASSADFEIYNKVLWDCGKSACTYSGLQVPGSAGCSYVTADIIYDETGAIVKPSGSLTPYVVDPGRCFLTSSYATRRVCGNTCEFCANDAECQAKYPTEICSNHVLQDYGCFKETVCKEELPSGACFEEMERSWCDLKAGEYVQCCNSNDCVGFGYNFFCDMTTHTCKQQAECTYDAECGTLTGCDRDTMSLVEGKCIGGQCQKQAIKSVDCCVDMDCPTNYFCSYPDYTCKEKPEQKISCPFDCCVNEPLYYDKACAAGQSCVDNVCKAEDECREAGSVCGGLLDKPCCDGLVCVGAIPAIGGGRCQADLPWALIFATLAAVLTFLLSGGKALKKKDEVGMAIASILAIFAFIVTWWVVTNWVAIAISLGIMTVLGAAGLYFFGGALIVIFAVLSTLMKSIKGE